MDKVWMVVLAITISCSASSQQNFEIISSDQLGILEAEKDDLIFLDVRTPREVSAGHIKDALLIDFRSPKFTEEIKNLDRKRSYVVYCASGIRSNKAMQIMKDLGFKEVYDLSGGYKSYVGKHE
ncbi:MAG: rhodanese-like domain-containing protein [Saprospiraceae bacterium]|nr:rhodanese-like domain-containing protein [Saprospiraceae bacterium]